MKKKSSRTCLALLLAAAGVLAAAGLTGCGRTGRYRVPEQLDDGWPTANAADAGLNSRLLSRMVARIERGRYQDIHGILVVRQGKLVFEAYFPGYRFDYSDEKLRGEYVEYAADIPHNTMSVTKAVTAALTGIAIGKGCIPGVEEPILTYFSRYGSLIDEARARITVKHLLTMTSGLAWNEWDLGYTDTSNDLIQLFIVDDPIAYILSRESAHEPGLFWYYSGGDVNLLGKLLEEATGMRLDAFADTHLFGPLGVTDAAWQRINPAVVYASGELALRPRDMAKFGWLYLNGGIWDGKSILASGWIEDSLREQVSTRGSTEEGHAYGYQWFLKNYRSGRRSFEAVVRTGWGGQAIVLFPDLEMLVVLTGGNYLDEVPTDELLQDYILPAVE